MAEYVVTGGQGFIGKNLTQRLVEMGLDVCSTYSYTFPSEPDSRHLKHFKLNVTQFDDCLKLINQENPKVIFHLVAQPVVTAAMRHPFSTMELTVRGSYNLFEAIRQSGKPVAVMCISSDKVYGENMSAKESDPLNGTDHPYNAAKICEDVIAQSYAKSFGLPIGIVRSANIYGRGDLHWDRLVPSVCKDILTGTQPTLRSNGQMMRDYIFIDDILDAYIKVVECIVHNELPYGTPINFGSDECYTPSEITDLLLRIAGSSYSSPIIQNGARDEIPHQHIDYSFAKQKLGWTPKTNIQNGLEQSYQWYKEYFSS